MPPQRGPRPRGRRPQRAPMPQPLPEPAAPVAVAETSTVVSLPKTIVVGDLARALDVSVVDVIRGLVNLGTMASINQSVDFETATLVANELGFETRAEEEVAPPAEEEATPEPISTKQILWEDVDPAKLKERPPVITVLGPVDHAKTSLLDAIRATNVTAREAGGITQHIGAYQIEHNGRKVTFLDTPGHEAFTAMRARGAQVTDVAVLVVAADDGVQPQTIEAISHIKAAQVPIVVALNKIDRPDANTDQVKAQLAEHGVTIEEYGGDTPLVPVSAKTKQGIDDLVETVLLVADVAELKADPDRPAIGRVIEAHGDQGRDREGAAARGRPLDHPRRCGRHHRIRPHARGGVERRRDRVQHEDGGSRAARRRGDEGRCAPVQGHLRAARRRAEGAHRNARAGDGRVAARSCRGPPDLHLGQDDHRRIARGRWSRPARRTGTAPPRRGRGVRREDRNAPAYEGRRS